MLSSFGINWFINARLTDAGIMDDGNISPLIPDFYFTATNCRAAEFMQ
jgi:hypothetical protein